MKLIKKITGLICLAIAPVMIAALFVSAAKNIDVSGKLDINKPVPWIIIILIFTPIAVGLVIFGWYAWKGEYDHLPERSDELE